MPLLKKNLFRAFSDENNYPLIILLFVSFSLLFLDGGKSIAGQILFFSTPLLVLPLVLLKTRSLPKHFYLLFFLWLFYLLANLISTLNSISLSLSVPTFMETLGVFVYWILFSLLITNKKQIGLITNFIVGAGFLLAFISLYYLIPQAPKPISDMNLFYAKWGHNHLASYLLLVLPIVLIGWIKEKKTKRWGLLSIFFLLSFLLTFSRGAFAVFPLIPLILLFKFRQRAKRSKKLILAMTALIPIFLVVGIFIISNSQLLKARMENYQNLSWLHRQLIKPIDKEGRFNYWQQAIKGWRLKPLLGNGPGTFLLTSIRFQKKPDSNSLYAHSSLLKQAAETGSIGATAFLLLTLIPLIWLWKKQIASFPLLLGATALWLHSLIDFDFNFLAIWLIFWMILTGSHNTLNNLSTRKASLKLNWIIIGSSIVLFIFVSLATTSKILLIKAENQKNVNSSLSTKNYQRALTIFPFDQNNWIIALTELQSQQIKGYFLETAQFYNKKNPYLLKLIGQRYLEQGKGKNAIDIYRQLTLLDPNNLFFPLELVRIYSQEDKLDLALVHLQKAGKVEINYQRFQYPEFDLNYSPHIAFLSYSSQISNIYLQKLSSIKPQEIAQISSPGLAILFYELGLLASQHEETNLVTPFWESAVYLAPEWSYFHIELANSYLINNQASEAEKQLNFCFQFKYPREHCQEYMDENYHSQSPESIGFLKEKVGKIVN